MDEEEVVDKQLQQLTKEGEGEEAGEASSSEQKRRRRRLMRPLVDCVQLLMR
jgi:hypothetical protein